MTTRSQTPPNHPTYNVHVSEEVVRKIVESSLPGAVLEKYEQLETGKSFNNRIYFLSISDNATSNESQQLVLKVCGQFWGATKVQNEVCCISMLQEYCPNIPVPKIIAWSEDGKSVRLPSKPRSISDGDFETRGWILLSKVPGRLISQEDLQGEYGDHLMKSLAEHVAQWRQKLPIAKAIGNLKFSSSETEKVSSNKRSTGLSQLPYGPRIDGILVSAVQPPIPLETPFEYYKFRLEANLGSLQTQSIYRMNTTRLSDPVKSFLEKYLTTLPLFATTSHHQIVFTHLDLSPRNILISQQLDRPPEITGIIDLEFAGFFLEEDEFTNTVVLASGDWPPASYQVFLDELERLGIRTPLTDLGKGKGAWDQACALIKVIENIAPWWVSEEAMSKEKLAEELEGAAIKVEEGLRFLTMAADTPSDVQAA